MRRTLYVCAWVLALSTTVFAQTVKDPGIRQDGINGAGGSLPALPSYLQDMFSFGQADFVQQDAVSSGLGPTFNLDSCGGCHVQPAIGGTSPPTGNPQFTFYQNNKGLSGRTDALPYFITQNGPVREARFPSDGGVHDVFTITGLPGASGCKIPQPDFHGANLANNIIFRIPTPVFGGGVIEEIQDSALKTNLAAQSGAKNALGISGHFNISGNDGTIARFGWKAQNKSLLMFAGEAYNVEIGVSNELFTQERNEVTSCQFVTVTNDTTNPNLTGLAVLSDIEKFANFMRLLDVPVPSKTVPGGSASITAGAAAFNQIGCGLCHTPSLPTNPNSTIAQIPAQANLFSDLALHHMGSGLADGVSQGLAGPDEFRTAPLWGLGKRAFFLHDGRTSDLVATIQAHATAPSDSGTPSEANGVVANFNSLSPTAQQNLLNFLRSL